jgi:proteasome beta subunit
MSFDAYIPGATAVGVTYKDGVVLGAERRITLGSMVVSKKGKKVFMVTDNVGAVCAGMVADMQNLVKEVGVYAKLKELEAKRQLKASAVAKLTSVIMFERRFSPLLTQVILGGLDAKPKIWVLDPLGSLLTDEYASVGTGAEMATGVMEAGYSAGMSEKDARELVVSSIKAAIERDSMSGNGIDLLTLDKGGFREEALPT